METKPNELLQRLLDWMKERQTVLVAYSGGVDSALVLAAAHQALGEKALGCIGVSPSYPEREFKGAMEFAAQIGAKVRLVNTTEHLDPGYAANPTDRCYYCKSDLYTHLTKVAEQEGFSTIADGNNASDLGDYRPGHNAAVERHVRSPLTELGITKDQVRALAHELGLPLWNKPAMACLSSRVPHGTPIVPGLLRQIERAEDFLVTLGFKQFRVRHHGELARIELPLEDLPVALARSAEIVAGVRAAGYKIVTLDLAGFRSGSMNGQTVKLNVQEPH